MSINSPYSGEGICLLCRNISSVTTETSGRKLGLKLLFKYLKINASDLLNFPAFLAEGEEECGEDDDLEVIVDAMCELCSDMVTGFKGRYQEFERARLEVSRNVQSLSCRLQEYEKVSRMGEKSRKEIISKCNLKIISNPRVTLEGMSVPNRKIDLLDLVNDDAEIENLRDLVHDTSVDSRNPNLNEPMEDSDDDDDEGPPVLELYGKSDLPSVTSTSKSPPSRCKPTLSPSTKSKSLSKSPEENTVRKSIRQQLRKGEIEVNPIEEPLPPQPTCNVCGKIFTSTPGLAIHAQKVHKKVAVDVVPLTCLHCLQVSPDRGHMSKHMIAKHPLTALKDKLPPETNLFQFETAIQKLRKQCEKPDDMQYFGCCLCSERYQEFFEWKVHVLKVHFEAVLTTLKAINHHHHLEKQKVVLQTEKKNVEEEKRQVGENGEVNPEAVSTTAPTPTANIAPFVCVHCGKSSTRRQYHRNHLIISHTLKFFENQLPRGTTEKQLQQAIKAITKDITVEGVDKQKRFKCPLCPICVSRRSTIKGHLLASHFNQVSSKLSRDNTQVLIASEASSSSSQCHDDDDLIVIDDDEESSMDQTGLIEELETSNGSVLQVHSPREATAKLTSLLEELRENEKMEVDTEEPLTISTCEITLHASDHEENWDVDPLRQDTSSSTGDGGFFECNICGSVYDISSKLIDHLKQVHCKEEAICCECCEKTCNTNEDYEVHMMGNHLMEAFSKDITPDTTEQSLRCVLAKQTRPVNQWGSVLECVHCNETFLIRVDLNLHLQKHHLSEILSLLAIEKITGQNTALVNTAAGQRHICPHCRRAFAVKCALSRHIKSKHTYFAFQKDLPPGTTDLQLKEAIMAVVNRYRKCEDDPQYAYGCPHCPRNIRSVTDLRLHILNSHICHVMIELIEMRALDKLKSKG